MKQWIVLILKIAVILLICGLMAACSPMKTPTTAPAATQPLQSAEATAMATATQTPIPPTSQPTPMHTLTSTPTPIPTATVYHTLSPTEIWPTQKAAFALTATAEPLPPLDWKVEVLQDRKLVAAQDGAYPVKKTHFTLRTTLPKRLFETLPFEMLLLNVSDKDENYRKIQPGSLDAQTIDVEAHIPFCIKLDPDCFWLGGLAQADHSTYSLGIDQRQGWGSHLMSYTDPKHSRWIKVLFGDQQVILEQDVYVIELFKPDGSNQIIQLPYYSGEKLYLIFFLKYRAGPVVTEDELKKIILKLE